MVKAWLKHGVNQAEDLIIERLWQLEIFSKKTLENNVKGKLVIYHSILHANSFYFLFIEVEKE